MSQTPRPLSLQSCSEGQDLSAAEVTNPRLDNLWASRGTSCLLLSTSGVSQLVPVVCGAVPFWLNCKQRDYAILSFVK